MEINICERVWFIIKSYTWTKTMKDAKRFLKEAYSKITSQDLRNMFKDLPKRIQEVKEKWGGKTHYWSDSSHTHQNKLKKYF